MTLSLASSTLFALSESRAKWGGVYACATHIRARAQAFAFRRHETRANLPHDSFPDVRVRTDFREVQRVERDRDGAPLLQILIVAAEAVALERRLRCSGGRAWLIVVPRHPGAVEIFDLDADQRAQLMREVALLAQHLKELTGCHKINIGSIGNVVSQLHVHVVARRRDDPAWPRPVWGALPARPYAGAERDGAERDRLIEALRRQINFI